LATQESISALVALLGTVMAFPEGLGTTVGGSRPPQEATPSDVARTANPVTSVGKRVLTACAV
jgi:hypothetical protein